MIWKKVLATLLTATLALGIVGCGSTNSTSSTTGESNSKNVEGNVSYEKIVYSYATFNNIPETSVLRTIEEAINEITREKIGVEVELMPVPIFEYVSNVTLAMQGGEQIDIFQTLGNFNVAVSSNMAYDLSELLDTAAPETKELLGDFLDATSKDGGIYAIPTYKPYALTPMIIYRQDIAEELNIDMQSIQSIYELTEVLATVKEAYPTMLPLIPVQSGDSGMGRTIEEVDYLTDDQFSPKGVLMSGELTVVDLYSSNEFANLCNLTREWYNNGLIMKDAATTTSTATELMASGNSFCYIASYSYPEEDTAASLQSQTGNYEIGAQIIGDAYLATDSISAVSWMVSSMSKVPEAAVKFLNLTFTDEELVNILIYGIEGRDYVMDADGYVSYPDGEDASTVPYTAQLSCGTLGNYFIMHPMVGTNKESLVWEEEQNVLAKRSPAMGFIFDSNAVKTEYTAVTNTINKYLPGLSCGSVEPSTALPEFIESLNAAGYKEILAEKQKQLDEWLEKNK